MMMQSKILFVELTQKYQSQIEDSIKEYLAHITPQNELYLACKYALLNGGKRFRPLLVFLIADTLPYKQDVSLAALAVEFFHTASLIVDDLPCMDNALNRRGKPAVHCLYGESTALLATYALISAGYDCLLKNMPLLSQDVFAVAKEKICLLAIENVNHNTGLQGATAGQFLDLSKDTSLSIEEVIQKKTISLFEISFVLGWLFGGGNPDDLSLVKKAAAHFGMAFQIADDLQDMSEDKAQNHKMNIANLYGEQKAQKILQEEIEGFEKSMHILGIDPNTSFKNFF